MHNLITTNEGVADTCAYFKDHDWIALDIETTALDPFNGVIRLIQLSDGNTTHIIDLFEVTELDPLRELLLSAKRKVIHNAKFDAKWIRHHLGVEVGGLFCTMLASQLIAAGDVDHKHSLAAVTERYLGQVLDKTEQVSDWGQEELDPAQLEYAAKDAAILLPLKDKIWDALVANDLLRVMELENECVLPVLQMELNGFSLDWPAWQAQLDVVNAHTLFVSAELQDMLAVNYPHKPLFGGSCNINLDSTQQVTDALEWAGVPATASTEEWRLQPLVVTYPVVGKLLDYRGLAKAQSSYGSNWQTFINPGTGRVHAEFNQARAVTGRFGCSNPNLQQIPQESAYRACFRAAPGGKLIIADYSQIELRIIAYRSGDERFIAAFNSGQDFHQSTAAEVFSVPLDEVTPEQRTFAKRLNFGIVYGIGAPKFAALTGVTKVEAEEFMEKYFTAFPGLNRYLRDEGRQAVVNRKCRSESGRTLKLRFDDEDRGSIGSAKRYGVNMPIQGTSADILKRALRRVHDRITGTDIKLVNIVHDEIILEAPEGLAWYASAVLKAEMIKAGEEFVSKVPIEVEVGISDVWKK